MIPFIDPFEGDVLMFQTPDGGDINATNGNIEMTGGFETAAYLSLFGGNERDDGRAGNMETWWGNLLTIDPAEKYISRTQFLLRNIPAVSGNLRRVEEAALEDLKWFKDKSIANEITAEASIPALNTLKLRANIFALGEVFTFEFIENWRAQSL